jgi:hypothetical protein
MKVCARCGRRGTQAFRILDRTIENNPIWACSNGRTCMVQRGRSLRRESEAATSPLASGIQLTPLRAKRRQATLPPRVLVLTGSSELGAALRDQLAAELPGSVSVLPPGSHALGRIGSPTVDLLVIDVSAGEQIAFRNGLIRALTRPRLRRVPVLLLTSDPATLRAAWGPVLSLSNVRSIARPLSGGDLVIRARAALAAGDAPAGQVTAF